MRISVEVSMYPLSADYKKAVRAFVEDLQSKGDFEVRVNGMSTQLFGEFDLVVPALTAAFKSSMERSAPVSFVTKFLSSDVSKYSFENKG